MTRRQLKTFYFSLTALNTLSSCYFCNYLFFFLRDRFGFGDRENLWASALYGFVYIFSAWQCGKFAQRRGFLTSLKVGFSGLALVLVAGALLDTAAGVLCMLAGFAVVLLFTWPALEALVSENESQSGVQHMVGIYNCTWAAAAAVANFTGGKLYDWHPRAIFWVPAALCTAQFLLVFWISPRAARVITPKMERSDPLPHHPEAAAFRQPVSPQSFLKMAWLVNPFAYVAVNTLIAVMPGLAEKFALSPTKVGLFCSVWFLSRLMAFALLWKWRGWHYRFRWLLTSFLVLIASFASILLTTQLWLVVVAQIFFGFAVGLIYYSSLFYSMDVGDTKGEHGGLHEAAIGIGMFAGSAVGAISLQFWPGFVQNNDLLPGAANASAFAVSGLLLCGLAALIWLRLKK